MHRLGRGHLLLRREAELNHVLWLLDEGGLPEALAKFRQECLDYLARQEEMPSEDLPFVPSEDLPFAKAPDGTISPDEESEEWVQTGGAYDMRWRESALRRPREEFVPEHADEIRQAIEKAFDRSHEAQLLIVYFERESAEDPGSVIVEAASSERLRSGWFAMRMGELMIEALAAREEGRLDELAAAYRRDCEKQVELEEEKQAAIPHWRTRPPWATNTGIPEFSTKAWHPTSTTDRAGSRAVSPWGENEITRWSI